MNPKRVTIGAILSLMMLCSAAIPAAAWDRNQWGAFGAGMLLGTLNAPQPQVILVAPEIRQERTVVVPSYQPAPPPRTATIRCIAANLVNNRFTLVNGCEYAAMVTWGPDGTQIGQATFNAEVTLPAGSTQVWAAPGYSSVSWFACPFGQRVIDPISGLRAIGSYPGKWLECR